MHDDYRLLLVSKIPVYRSGGRCHAMDLWAADLQAQARACKSVRLACPLRHAAAPEGAAPIPGEIEVVDLASLRTRAGFAEAAADRDAVQVPCGRPRWRSRIELRCAERAVAMRKVLVVGVTSNRHRTTLMNAKSAGFIGSLKARLVAGSILRTQQRLANMATGVFLIGEGLADMLDTSRASTFINTASWIRAEDVITAEEARSRLDQLEPTAPKIVAAARLEYMKGIHVAIDAVAHMIASGRTTAPHLTILGEGPEEEDLRAQVAERGLGSAVSFGGQLAYPVPFSIELARHDFLAITNLNVEQPRVLFDALSRGVLAVCPRTRPYEALGLPVEALYEPGDAVSLGETIAALSDAPAYELVLGAMLAIVRRHTIDTMHAARARWMSGLVAARGTGAEPARS